MPRIPLSGERKPQKEVRGGNDRKEGEIQETEEEEEERGGGWGRGVGGGD